jgi:multiple sugar transport system permease protein
MTAAAPPAGAVPARDIIGKRPRRKGRRLLLHAFLIGVSLLWLFPLLWAVYTSLRPYADTSSNAFGYISIGGHYNLDNFANAWDRANLPQYYLNTLLIVVPAVIVVLALASMVAFAVSRFSFRFNVGLLMLFTAGNLLPQQVIITPLYRMFLLLPLPNIFNAPGYGPFPSDNGLFYDQYVGIIAIHVAFQLGFCTFVLSNFMKTIPKELTEAAIMDGSGVLRMWWSVILPLCRPALAALATLEFTFIYNDFLWALLLMRTGSKLPITSALNNLGGQFFTDNNLVAAGALMVALPTLVVYFLLQKQFIGGLTLGSTKG